MSIHPEILALIHADIDGIASEADRLRLHEAIATDAAVRDEYRRLRGLCDVLSRVEREEPPMELAPSVMRAVRAHRRTIRPGFLGRARAFWPSGPPQAIRYAYALAAGAAIGILGFQLVTGGNLFGPALHERDATATIGTAHKAGRLDLAPAGIRGSATLRAAGSGAAIGLDLTAREPFELVLRYDPAKDGGRVDVQVVRDGETTEAGSLQLSQGK